MPDGALGRVAEELPLVDAEKEAEITHVEAFRMVFSWQWSEVPGLKPVPSKLN